MFMTTPFLLGLLDAEKRWDSSRRAGWERCFMRETSVTWRRKLLQDGKRLCHALTRSDHREVAADARHNRRDVVLAGLAHWRSQ